MDTSKSKENSTGGDLSLSGKWTVFGVYPPSSGKPESELPAGIPSWSPYRNGVDPDVIPAPEETTAIPDHLELAGVRREPRTIHVSNGVLDMRTVLGPMNLWDTAYVYIPVTVQEPQQVTLGFGAKGWIQVWVNGRQILSTMKSGNHYAVATIADFPVDVKLDKGTSMIVVRYVSSEVRNYGNDENAVIGYEWFQGLVLAAGGPAELQTFARERDNRYKLAREGRERIGPGVTKSTYIPTDGFLAFYAGSQTYASARGMQLLELYQATTAHWQINEDGNRVLNFIFPIISQERISEDNGRTWKNHGDSVCFDKENPEEQLVPNQCMYQYLLPDTRNNLLVKIFAALKVDAEHWTFTNEGCYRPYYAISRDQGKTWGAPIQIVDKREGYNSVRWGPEFEYGEIGGYPDGNWVWMDDGSVVASFDIFPKGKSYYKSICARGYWRKDMSGFDWVFGEPFVVPPEKSPCGCCEPTIASLGGDNVFIVTRCQGDPSKGIYAHRYSGFSQDGGMTWSEPEPLKYDDGSIVWSPASFTRFFVSSRTGKTYWLANIIDRPVFSQEPRYPLTIAEFDLEKRCIIKNSVRIIQDRPENANEHVRYTNFGHYEDRETGNLVITLPEEFRYLGHDEYRRLEDNAADCVKYIVELT